MINCAADTQMKRYVPIVRRLVGNDRYVTAVPVSSTIAATSDAAFPAAATGGHLGGPMLLATHATLPNTTKKPLDRFNPSHSATTIQG